MKSATLLLFAFQATLHTVFANLSFDGYHYDYDCTADPVACQQMCFYFYCAGQSNCVDRWPDEDIKAESSANRRKSGMKDRPFNQVNIARYGTSVVDTLNTCPDEWPPASSRQGGTNAILMGHGKEYSRQGGKISDFWNKAKADNGGTRVCIEPYNWDSTLSPACNCKPNIPEHHFTNPYGGSCDCDNDIMRHHQYRLTKSKQDGGPNFSNYLPDSYWSKEPWNYKGYPPSKKREETDEEPKVETPKVEAKAVTPETV